MTKLIRTLMIMVMLLPVLVVAGCSESPADEPVLAPGAPAPDFQLQSLDGEPVSLSSFHGRPVLLNFWATWCGPCRDEMPFLQEVFEDSEWAEQGLVMLAVNLGENPDSVRQFMEDNNLSFTVLLDADGEVAKTYNTIYVPTTYFIDINGIIIEKKVGSFQNKAEIDWMLVNSILEEVS